MRAGPSSLTQRPRVQVPRPAPGSPPSGTRWPRGSGRPPRSTRPARGRSGGGCRRRQARPACPRSSSSTPSRARSPSLPRRRRDDRLAVGERFEHLDARAATGAERHGDDARRVRIDSRDVVDLADDLDACRTKWRSSISPSWRPTIAESARPELLCRIERQHTSRTKRSARRRAFGGYDHQARPLSARDRARALRRSRVASPPELVAVRDHGRVDAETPSVERAADDDRAWACQPRVSGLGASDRDRSGRAARPRVVRAGGRPALS